MFRKLWDAIRNRSPSERHAMLSKRLRQTRKLGEVARMELNSMGPGRDGKRRRAERRLGRINGLILRLERKVAAARPAVMRAH